MSALLLAALVAMTLTAAAEAYVLIGRGQRLLTHAEQILAALGARVAAVPGKSAPRTDGSGTSPRIWWQRLRDLTVPDEPDTAPIADVITPQAIVGDPVDEALARFSYADGHAR